MDSCLNNDQFREVVLIAGIDGRRISARVSVLVESSDYFAAMFTGSLRESTAKEVILEEVSGDILELLVHYSHTGHLELQEEVVNELLVTAQFLQFNSVVTLCSNFIIQHLNSSNYHEFALFAKANNLDFLLKRINHFVRAHFIEVSENSKFLELEADEVAEFIASDDINVQSEEFIASAVKYWLHHDLETRKKHIPALLSHVRVPLLRPEYILENIEPLCSTKEMELLIVESLKYNLLPYHKWIYAEKLIEHRKPHRLLLAISKNDCSIEVYNKTKWSLLHSPCEQRSYVNVVAINEKLFIAGGFSFLRGSFQNSIKSLCMRTMHTEIFDVPFAMESGPLLAHCHGLIYMKGEELDENNSNQFKIWNPNNEKWLAEKSPNFPRFNAAICVHDNNLYFVGGENIQKTKTNVVEAYSILRNIWEPITSMQLARSNHGIAVVNNCLYAIGGQTRKEGSIERYNPVTKEWTLIPAPDLLGSSVFSCTAINNLIYVGSNKQFLEYDPARNVWKHLDQPAAKTFVLVTVPNVIPVYFYREFRLGCLNID